MLRTLANVWYYAKEMLPLALVALGVLLLCGPWRRSRLVRQGLVSSRTREVFLAVFVAFCGGLAAITLFPEGFWNIWANIRYGRDPWWGFYPWERALSSLAAWEDMLIPFQEIRRAFRVGSYWLWFLLAGNSHVHAHRLFPQVAFSKMELVEVPAGGFLRFGYH